MFNIFIIRIADWLFALDYLSFAFTICFLLLTVCVCDLQLESWGKQDKVNYAVSEREDWVTGAATLTRMAGSNGMYWAATVLC